VVGGSLDVTRQRELEEQVRKSQRMAAISSLSAGVAHNFNNMPAVITPILELTSELVATEHRKMLEDALHAALRAADLVRQLMTYAGQSGSPERVRCELGQLVRAALGICRRTFTAQIKLRLEQSLDAGVIDGNPGQIEQILVNLLLNARDAIDEGKRGQGTITVRMRRHLPDESPPSAVTEGQATAWVCVDVIDDGAGLSQEAQARLFEPFFTTKPFGKGTGLGLPTSYAIARDHGGTLTCKVQPAGETCFTLALPLAAGRVLSEPPSSRGTVRPGTEVLIVDDDEVVRRTLRRMLTASQLHVREASTGEAALEELRARPSTQVVILDRAMPGGAGERFVPRIREIARAARIVFLSGGVIEPELLQLADAVLAKPVSSAVLLDAIARVLSVDSSGHH
jgi:two-component system, cell cycle sensor histidine kinase and response regulator CckA